jgi:predicted small secreted protein
VGGELLERWTDVVEPGLAAPGATQGSTTVSTEAPNWAFWHFGEFSRAYSDSFGELPSDTLRRKPGEVQTRAALSSLSYTSGESPPLAGSGYQVHAKHARNALNLRNGAQARRVQGEGRNAISRPTTEGRNTVKTLLVALASLPLFALTACNTVEGAGKDVKATGAVVEKAAADSKPK